jgi:cytochrome c-type biogenesis protein CcmH
MTVPTHMTDSISTLKQQLLQLKELHDSGTLSSAQYEESRRTLERRLVDQVLLGGVPMAGSAGERISERISPATMHAEALSGSHDTPPQKLSRGWQAALVAGVLVLAGAGYWWKGSPDQMGAGLSANVGAGTADAPEQGASAAPHATGAEQIAAMVEKLAERMKAQPDDAEGWAMLARSYTVLGRNPEALKAYERAVALRSDDPVLLVDYADSLAMNNNRTLAGEPMKWVDKALKLDPRNLKGLSLAGTAAFLAKDYAGAVKYWDQVVAIGPADSVFVQQVQGGLVEARELGKLPAAKPMVLAPAATAAAPMALSGKTVSGTVSLAPALAKQAAPDDTVFVFARAAEGRGMPLAILRKKVRDLPIEFTLDDSSSMSPAATLSGAGTVVVGARISKSGNAMPQSGDMSGQTEPIPVGTSALKIQIRDVVKP